MSSIEQQLPASVSSPTRDRVLPSAETCTAGSAGRRSGIIITSFPGLPPRLYFAAVEKSPGDFLHGCEIKSGQEAWERG